MKTTLKKFSKETIKKYTHTDTRSSLPLVEWKPDLNKSQRRAIVNEVKRMLKDSVIYFRQAMLPGGVAGVAYLTPATIFWQGNSLYITGDVVYIGKQDGKTTVFKTYDTNYVLPEYVVRTITHKEFTDVLEKRYKQLTPKAKF